MNDGLFGAELLQRVLNLFMRLGDFRLQTLRPTCRARWIEEMKLPLVPALFILALIVVWIVSAVGYFNKVDDAEFDQKAMQVTNRETRPASLTLQRCGGSAAAWRVVRIPNNWAVEWPGGARVESRTSPHDPWLKETGRGSASYVRFCADTTTAGKPFTLTWITASEYASKQRAIAQRKEEAFLSTVTRSMSLGRCYTPGGWTYLAMPGHAQFAGLSPWDGVWAQSQDQHDEWHDYKKARGTINIRKMHFCAYQVRHQAIFPLQKVPPLHTPDEIQFKWKRWPGR